MRRKIPAIRTLTAILSLLVISPVFAETAQGSVRVIDGDTFQFETGLKVRIFGIDTLEKNQRCEVSQACVPCGRQSQEEAIKMIGGSEVVCHLKGQKTYDREVATCFVDGKDYGLSMIAAGWALAYRSYLPKKGKNHPYVAAETAAKAASAGIWGMRFVPPSDWRNRRARLQCER